MAESDQRQRWTGRRRRSGGGVWLIEREKKREKRAIDEESEIGLCRWKKTRSVKLDNNKRRGDEERPNNIIQG